MKSILHILASLCFGIACFLPLTSLGQSSPSEQDTTIMNDEIEEITITAFRSPYNVFNTPAPVNLILSTQLETGNALTPVDALNRIPGILMHHGTLNTNRLTIRELDRERLTEPIRLKPTLVIFRLRPETAKRPSKTSRTCPFSEWKSSKAPRRVCMAQDWPGLFCFIRKMSARILFNTTTQPLLLVRQKIPCRPE